MSLGFLKYLNPLFLVDSLLNVGSHVSSSIQNENQRQRQNRFNAEQAQLNRDFQSQQAEIARDWQENQYLMYSSPEAMVRQYQQAGLNPALMHNNSLQGTTGSSPSPSGSTASGSALGSPLQHFSGIVQDFLGLQKLDAEIDNMRAQAEERRANAVLSGSYVEVNKTVSALNKKQFDRIDAEVNLMKEQAKTEIEKRNALVIEKAFNIARSKQIEFSNAMSQAFKEKTGVAADAHTISMLILSASQLVGNVINATSGIVSKFFGKKGDFILNNF